MLNLRKPLRLRKGDRVAAVSLSRGLAGDEGLRWRYEAGKRRLREDFGLDVVEMPNTLAGSEILYRYPEKRAEDLMAAFADPLIRGVFSCIGGNDSIRMLPFIDFGVIAQNPKVFLGYSDTTVTHFICLKAGLSSFYGASVLAEFAENVRIFEYTERWIRKVLFEGEAVGDVPPSPVWTGEIIPWEEKNSDRLKRTEPHEGYELLQGEGVARGRLIGGCIEVMEMIKGTELWPPLDAFDGAILFFETSENQPKPAYIESWLRNYGAQGILRRINGILWGKPAQNRCREEYRETISRVLTEELGLPNLPVLFDMNFGHNEPMCCLPYGALAEIDCARAGFSILEPGVA